MGNPSDRTDEINNQSDSNTKHQYNTQCSVEWYNRKDQQSTSTQTSSSTRQGTGIARNSSINTIDRKYRENTRLSRTRTVETYNRNYNTIDNKNKLLGLCNCIKDKICPLNYRCSRKNLLYRCKIISEDGCTSIQRLAR